MQLRKFLVYIACTFALFPAVDTLPFFEATSDCHPRIKDGYFSTLLQADKQWLCDICEIGFVNNSAFIISTSTETILSGRYPVISVFGAKPVIPYVTPPWAVWDASTVSGSTVFATIQTIRGLPNPLVMDLLVRWENDMKNFWARSRLAKWQERQQRETDATDDRVRGMDQLHEQAAYKDAVAGFYYTLHLAPEKPAAYYYRATAKLTLGDTESTLGNVEQAQHLYRTAIQDYTHAISRTPLNIDAYVFRSYARFRLGILAATVGNMEQAQRHYHAAIADCGQAIGLYQDEAALKAALAVYTDVSDGMRDYPGAIRLREEYAFAYHLRGLERQALGQHAAAAADLQKAKVLQLMPEYRGSLAPTLGQRSGW